MDNRKALRVKTLKDQKCSYSMHSLKMLGLRGTELNMQLKVVKKKKKDFFFINSNLFSQQSGWILFERSVISRLLEQKYYKL